MSAKMLRVRVPNGDNTKPSGVRILDLDSTNKLSKPVRFLVESNIDNIVKTDFTFLKNVSIDELRELRNAVLNCAPKEKMKLNRYIDSTLDQYNKLVELKEDVVKSPKATRHPTMIKMRYTIKFVCAEFDDSDAEYTKETVTGIVIYKYNTCIPVNNWREIVIDDLKFKQFSRLNNNNKFAVTTHVELGDIHTIVNKFGILDDVDSDTYVVNQPSSHFKVPHLSPGSPKFINTLAKQIQTQLLMV
jgi:hypothetical protein